MIQFTLAALALTTSYSVAETSSSGCHTIAAMALQVIHSAELGIAAVERPEILSAGSSVVPFGEALTYVLEWFVIRKQRH